MPQDEPNMEKQTEKYQKCYKSKLRLNWTGHHSQLKWLTDNYNYLTNFQSKIKRMQYIWFKLFVSRESEKKQVADVCRQEYE